MGTTCAVPRGKVYYQIVKKKSRWRLICGRDWRGGEAVAQAMEGLGPGTPESPEKMPSFAFFLMFLLTDDASSMALLVYEIRKNAKVFFLCLSVKKASAAILKNTEKMTRN